MLLRCCVLALRRGRLGEERRVEGGDRARVWRRSRRREWLEVGRDGDAGGGGVAERAGADTKGKC